MTYLFNHVSRNEENFLPVPEKQVSYPKLVSQFSKLIFFLSTYLVLLPTFVRILFFEGSSVVSAGYCYFSFYDTFYKVLNLKLHLNLKNKFLGEPLFTL